MVGVSPSTVSRALNGKPGVSNKKRELIKKVLEENNYIPNEAARNLGTVKSLTVGIITDDLNSKHQNDAMARCQNELITNGYQCISRCMDAAQDGLDKVFAEFKSRRLSGVLLIGLSFTNHEKLNQVIERYIPDVPVLLVYQNERINRDNVYCIGANEKKGFKQCVDKLVKNRRKNLALIVEKNRASSQKIQKYFEFAANEFSNLEFSSYMDIESSREAARELSTKILTIQPDIDGIICTQDRLAIEIMYAFIGLGKKIPEDISIISEGNSELCEVCRPKLTALDTMVMASAMMSVRMLIDVMEGRVQTHKITLEMEIVNRETI